MQEMARIDARDKLKITEKDFSNLAFSRGVDSPGIARVRSAGDKALFGGHTTEEMKARIGVPNKNHSPTTFPMLRSRQKIWPPQ